MANYLIIAGTSGIGTAIVKKLLSDGHHVFITGRNDTKLQALSKEHSIPCALLDATDFSNVDDIFMQATDKIGPLSGVVNCAGSLLIKAAHLTQQEQYENILKTNLTTAFAVVRAAGKYLSEKGGSVVLISSSAALVGIASHEAISAAKAGIIGLALAAAATYASCKLRFNVVAPGLVETDLSASILSNAVARKTSEAMHPLGRLGKPNDIASAVCFFLEPENDWITGQVLCVDGGLGHIRPKMKI